VQREFESSWVCTFHGLRPTFLPVETTGNTQRRFAPGDPIHYICRRDYIIGRNLSKRTPAAAHSYCDAGQM
jgi:hypothetical protein